MRRRRLILLVDAIGDDAGGAERFVVGLALALPPERYEVVVATTRAGEGRLLEDLAAAGVRHVGVTRRTRFDLVALWRLYRLLRAERADIVHANKFGSNVWGVVFGRLAGIPAVVAQEHSWSYTGERLRPLLDGRVVGPLCDAFIAVSAADRDRMVRLEHVRPAKIEVIPTAYIPRAGEATADLRAELGLGPGVPIVGTVAILRPEKALEVLLEAFAVLGDEHPDAHLVVAGSGPCEEALRAQSAALGLGGRVHFLGLRQDVDAIWRAIDVGAISSDREGFPVAALEAMASGTPLVATAVGGMPELVTDGETGLLVAPRDPAAFAAALARLLADPAERAAMGAAGRERLRDYSLERLVERVEGLYDRLLRRPGRRAARAQRGGA